VIVLTFCDRSTSENRVPLVPTAQNPLCQGKDRNSLCGALSPGREVVANPGFKVHWLQSTTLKRNYCFKLTTVCSLDVDNHSSTDENTTMKTISYQDCIHVGTLMVSKKVGAPELRSSCLSSYTSRTSARPIARH